MMIRVSMCDHLNERPIDDALAMNCTGFEIEAVISGSSAILINRPGFVDLPYNTVSEYLSALITARNNQESDTKLPRWYLFLNVQGNRADDVSILYREIVQSGILNGIDIVIGNYTTYTSLFYLTYRSALNLAIREEFTGAIDYITIIQNA